MSGSARPCARRRLFARVLPCLLLLFAPLAAHAAGDLILSEYVEGSSNNKALEIFNGTGAAVDLGTGGYSIQMFFNGSSSAGLTLNLTGTVADGDVFVLAQASADAAILAVADQTSAASWFNGDDAVVLRRGTTVIDSLGQAGFDPGTEWGTGVASTADNTLRRKDCTPDTVTGDAFDPAALWDGFATNAFDGLGAHTCGDVPPPPPPPVPDYEIHEIQGAGLTSPHVGQTVRTLDNTVTGVAANGFFIQTPDNRADLNVETSNGIFVFTGSAPAVHVGDQVDVKGTVSEFFSQTEIDTPGMTEVTVDATGLALPAAILLDADTPSPVQPQPANEMERFEGMIVRIENGLATGPADRFGDTPIVAGPSRTYREPGILYPGLAGLPVWDGNPEILEVNPDGAGLSDVAIPAGAAITVAEGPVAFSFSDYQIWPTELSVNGTIALGPVRAKAPGEFTVASQNLLRLMDTVNDPCSDDVPTPAVYADRLNKVSLLIRDGFHAPDVVVVQEVENLGVLQAVAAKIQADDPSIHYTAHLLEGNDVGCIDIGFLVKDTVRVDSVEQVGKDDLFTFGTSTALLHDRPPLVLRGAYVGNGAPFPVTVIGIHNRSLSGIDGSDGARIRAKRHEQAYRISQYIQGLQTAEPGIRLVVTGDFNAFQFTDGYVDAIGQITGNPDPAGALIPATDEVDPDLTNQLLSEPEAERYSFVFDGSAQALDHTLTSQGLNPFIRGLDHVRGNADAPASLSSDPNTALRTADHDGLALFVMSDSDADSLADDVDLCPGTVLPEGIAAGALNPNHYALSDADLTFDTNGGRSVFTIQQTGGCSCTQILVKMGLGKGQAKNGCSQGTMDDWVLSVGQ